MSAKVIRIVSELARNTVNLILFRNGKPMIFSGYDSAAEARVNTGLANQIAGGDEFQVVDTREPNKMTLSQTGGHK